MNRTAWSASVAVSWLIAFAGAVQGQPVIDVSPAAVSSTQPADAVVEQTLKISNNGSAPLNWEIRETPGDCDPVADVPWLSTSPITGTIAALAMQPVAVTFDSTGLIAGTYKAQLCVASDDPNRPLVAVPATLTVPSPVPALSTAGLVGLVLIALGIALSSLHRRRHPSGA